MGMYIDKSAKIEYTNSICPKCVTRIDGLSRQKKSTAGMINGDKNELVDGLYYGDECFFLYDGNKYFIQDGRDMRWVIAYLVLA